MNTDTILFSEVQKINMVWLWIIIGAIVILMWVIAFKQLILHQNVGTNQGPDWLVAVLWIVFGIILPIFMLTSDLKTTLTDDSIYIQSSNRIMVNEHIDYEAIADYEHIAYKPIIQFGGWGNRGIESEKIYSVGGSEAIQLTLNNGNKVYIGTEQGEEIIEVLDTIIPK